VLRVRPAPVGDLPLERYTYAAWLLVSLAAPATRLTSELLANGTNTQNKTRQARRKQAYSSQA